MDAKSAAKVGLLTLIGLAMFAAAYVFFARLDVNKYRLTAAFKDTKGLVKQTPVRMNGVTIGEVKSIDLVNFEPVVTLSIEKKIKIPRNAKILITSGLLITTPQIEIHPDNPVSTYFADGEEWPKDGVQAEPVSGLASLSPEAAKAVQGLNDVMTELKPKMTQSFDKLNKILGHAEMAMANVQAASLTGRNLIANPNITPTMNAMLADLKALSKQARTTTTTMTNELAGLVKRNGPKLDGLADGLIDLLATFRDTVDAARSAATRLSEQVSDPRLQQSLLDTLDLTKATIARFNQIAADIHNLTGDATVQSDLKTTLSTVKETTEQGQKLVARLNDIAGKIPLNGGGPKLGIGSPEIMMDLLGRSRDQNFRSDVTMRLPIGTQNAARIGLYDFAESSRLTAQWESRMAGGSWARYGLYGGKLGFGLDWALGKGSQFVIDAWDPNHARIDARALFKLTPAASLWLGADSVNRRATPILGVRLTR